MKSLLIASAVLLATTTLAIAQEKVQISYSGIITLDHLDGVNYGGDYFYGNGDVSFRWSTVNDLKFGADVGIETFGFLNQDVSYDLSAYYAVGVVEGKFGKISIGMPRSVMSEYFVVPKVAGSELLDLDIGFLGSDLVRYVKLLLSDADGEMYGVRYDGIIGRFNVAASVSQLSDSYGNGTAGNIEEIVAKYAADQWSVTLGTVRFEQGGISANSTSLEVQGHSGKISGGFVFTKLGELFLGGGADDGSISRAFASYDVSEAVKLNAQIIDYQIFGNLDEMMYSFDVSYKHKTGAFVNAGVISGDTGIDKIFNVSLGYKF
jgi:hypothetical protein